MKETRTLVANHPRPMKGAVCATLSCQRDIEVVGDPQGEPGIFAAICDSALDEHPYMKIRAAALGSEDDTTATATITDVATMVGPTTHPPRAKKLDEKGRPANCPSRIFLDSIQTARRQNLVEDHEQAQLLM